MRPSSTKDWAIHSAISPQYVSHLCCPSSLNTPCFVISLRKTPQSQIVYKNNLFLLIIRNIYFHNNIFNNALESQTQSFSIHPSLQNSSLITFESVETGFSEGKQQNYILYLRNPSIQGRGYRNINKLNKSNIT